MYRMFVFTPALVFGTFAGIVHFQDRITYLNWIPDPCVVAVQAAHRFEVEADEVVIKTPDGEALQGLWCDRVSPGVSTLPQKPVVLFCDGNAGSVATARWVIDRWTSMIGADVLIFDYRGYGKSTGTPSENGLYQDARAAYDWLIREKKVDPQRILIVGQSLGGGVAMKLASEVEHQMLVLESTFTSLPQAADAAFFPASMGAFCREEFPTIERIRKYTKPVFISHGDCDSSIPCSHGERLFEAAGSPKHLWICKGLGHDDCRDESHYADRLRAFLKDHWKTPKGNLAKIETTSRDIAAIRAALPSPIQDALRSTDAANELPGNR